MFTSSMWTYIKEEKDILLNLLDNHKIQDTVESISNLEAIYFVAHGSSYNACKTIAPLISQYARVRAYVYTPSDFRWNAISFQYENKDTTAIFAVSQTGTSRGVLEILDSINDCKKIVITNIENSPIDQQGDITYYLQVKEEDSNAKTKGYSATLLLLILFGLELGSIKGYLSTDDKDRILQSIQQEIEVLPRVISTTIEWCVRYVYGKGMQNLCVLGNGVHYGSALEGALKLMETMCIPTTYNDIVEFSHGMHRNLKEDSYVLLLNASGEQDLMEKTFTYCKNKGMHVLMITGDDGIENENVIYVGKYPYTSSLFLIVCTIQVISVFVPEINGLNPNREANDEYTNYVETRV